MKNSKVRNVNQMLIRGGLVNLYRITIFNRNKDYERSSFNKLEFFHSLLMLYWRNFR